MNAPAHILYMKGNDMLTKNAMLIELNISVWTARRLDRGVSAEVDVTNNTKTRAGNYHKNLLAGTMQSMICPVGCYVQTR